MVYILYLSCACLGFLSTNTLEADMGNNCMYSKVLSLRDSDLYLSIPEGIITVRDSDLCYIICDPNGPYIPEGIITVRDSDLCHVMIQTGSMSSIQTGSRYLVNSMLQQLCPYRHAYLSLYQVLSRQSMCILGSVHILYFRIIMVIR